MPGDAPDSGGLHRIVVDESSFDFRQLEDASVQLYLDAFNESLDSLDRGTVAVPPWFFEHECRDGLDLAELAFGRTRSVDRDTALRFGLLASRCPEWDDSISGLPTEVALAGEEPRTVYSIGYAFYHAARAIGVACLVFGAVRRRGMLAVDDGSRRHDVYFFDDASLLVHFWRGLFELESVAEREFLSLAERAFPGLVYAPDLSFSKFEGGYDQLLPWVVKALGVINDHFAEALAAGAGIGHHVQAQLGQYGLDLSPESPKTHANGKAMREREVPYRGRDYSCQWHAKAEPHRNRIHFSTPQEDLGGRILIGIFTDHLTT